MASVRRAAAPLFLALANEAVAPNRAILALATIGSGLALTSASVDFVGAAPLLLEAVVGSTRFRDDDWTQEWQRA